MPLMRRSGPSFELPTGIVSSLLRPPSLLALLSAVVALVAPRLLLCAFAVNRPLQVTPVDAPIGTLAHRAPQRRRAVARWTANGAVTGGDPPLVPFDENQACPSSTPSRKRMTVITNIYGMIKYLR